MQLCQQSRRARRGHSRPMWQAPSGHCQWIGPRAPAHSAPSTIRVQPGRTGRHGLGGPASGRGRGCITRAVTTALLCAAALATLTAARVAAAAPSLASGDDRNVANGLPIGDFAYSDQAYCVQQPSPASPPHVRWLCVLTISTSHEGGSGETVVSVYSDDKGHTWSKPLELVPEADAAGIPVAYGVPVIAPGVASGLAKPHATAQGGTEARVYCLYNINSDNITRLPDGSPLGRHDEMGHFKFKFSDDAGVSWSAQQYEIPYRETWVDEQNPWGGGVKMMWTVDHPLVDDVTGSSNEFYMAFTKIGRYPQTPPEEVWVLTSPNLWNESDPTQVHWELLPDGDHGITNPVNATAGVAEEGHFMVLASGVFFALFRTEDGWVGTSTSTDRGHTWGASGWLQYAACGSTSAAAGWRTGNSCNLKNPRGPLTPRRFSNGYYLLLYYNDGFPAHSYHNRNPYWLAAGIESGGTVRWSEPEIILYDASQDVTVTECCGYPDFIEDASPTVGATAGGGGSAVFAVHIVETNKKMAATHLVNASLLAGLWGQLEGAKGVPTAGLAASLNASSQGHRVPAPAVPNFSVNNGTGPPQGFTIDLWVSNHAAAKAGQGLFDTRASSRGGKGISIGVTNASSGTTVALTMNDSATAPAVFTLDAECAAQLASTAGDGLCAHHLALVVDAGPRIVTAAVDGALCDGGATQSQGWAWFSRSLGDVNGGPTAAIASGYGGSLESLRVWDRALRTSEVVAAYRAGPPS